MQTKYELTEQVKAVIQESFGSEFKPTQNQIDSEFKPTQNQIDRVNEIRLLCYALAEKLVQLVPPGKHRYEAFVGIEDVMNEACSGILQE